MAKMISRSIIKSTLYIATRRFSNPLYKNLEVIKQTKSLLFQSQYLLFSSKAQSNEDFNDHVHFRATSTKHPLIMGDKNPSKFAIGSNEEELRASDHLGRQQNHIWSKEELQVAMTTLYRHKPVTMSDYVMNRFMYSLYHTFNFITGYKEINPTVKSIEWRLIVLESVAGVPGFVAAGFRHFRSLRQLRRDYGWIATLLEEAENERMHLLTCLKMFECSVVTRALVITAQLVMTPFLMAVYAINPKAGHRFVGYLEETACHTYVNVICHIETPGTHLNLAWKDVKAPPIAIGYWKLPETAKWVDTLKCMMADETHHRDCNHTFADMESDDPNPFLEQHKQDAMKAWRLEKSGQRAWVEDVIPDVVPIKKE